MAKDRDKPFRPYHKQILPPRRYECLFCQSQFRWNRDLEAHMNTHTNERPHFCDKCPASFPNPSYMGVHKRSHQKKIYKCDFCGKIFKDLGTLCVHRRVTHKVKPKKGERKIRTPQSCIISPSSRHNNHQIIKTPKPIIRKPRGRPPRRISDVDLDSQIKIEIKSEQESPPPSPNQKTVTPCFKRRLINKFRKEDFSEDVKEPVGYYGYEVPPAPPIIIPPNIPPNFVPFFAAISISDARKRSKNSEWDPSFFLHMNRYDPDQDLKKERAGTPEKVKESKEHLKIKRRRRLATGNVRREILKTNQTYRFGSIKRGRPRKDSDDQELLVKVEVKDLIDGKDWESLEGGLKARCPYCERVMFKNNVHSHALVHTGEKPFKCKFCDKKFRQKSHAIKHTVRYHRYGHEIGKPGKRKTPELVKEAEENLDCAFCGIKFNDKWVLEQHLYKIHGDEYKES